MRARFLQQARRALTWAGRVISAGAIVAVILHMVRTQVWRAVDLTDPRVGLTLAASSLAYAAGLAVIAYAWVRWLHSAGGHSVPTSAAMVLYCRSQLAKYIPGNVFHLVARQTLGSRLGAPHSAIALASVSECAALVLASCTLAALGDSLPSGFPRVSRAAAFGAAALFLGGAAWLARFLQRRATPEGGRRPAFWRQFAGTLATLACYFPFFLGNGFCLVLLLSAHTGGVAPSMMELTGLWSLCWLAGYLTPGAPGGLGIREAAMILVLTAWCPRPAAVAIATEMRLVSTLGDVLVWLCATVFRPAKSGGTNSRFEGAVLCSTPPEAKLR